MPLLETFHQECPDALNKVFLVLKAKNAAAASGTDDGIGTDASRGAAQQRVAAVMGSLEETKSELSGKLSALAASEAQAMELKSQVATATDELDRERKAHEATRRSLDRTRRMAGSRSAILAAVVCIT